MPLDAAGRPGVSDSESQSPITFCTVSWLVTQGSLRANVRPAASDVHVDADQEIGFAFATLRVCEQIQFLDVLRSSAGSARDKSRQCTRLELL